MEVNPPAGSTETEDRRREERGPRIGGDELKDAEEHF
jgi:hypothetical protein